ncbi:MAG: hypothetical protein JXJ22_15675 [Bacteroidales bacterium]|nr:hypothetical protein [Bacteroidales bacterium]
MRRFYKIGLILKIVWILLFINSCHNNSDYDFSPYSSEGNLALNDGTTKSPDPLESDEGWGGGQYPWQIIDGIRFSTNFWTSGLAFTGGKEEYIDTCGWRQATINFGVPVQFNRTVIWMERDTIDHYYIQYWNEENKVWKNAIEVSDKIKKLKEYYLIFYEEHFKTYQRSSIAYEDTFPTVTSSRIRFLFNNCNSGHGWINEFEVYYDKEGERPKCMVIRK